MRRLPLISQQSAALYEETRPFLFVPILPVFDAGIFSELRICGRDPRECSGIALRTSFASPKCVLFCPIDSVVCVHLVGARHHLITFWRFLYDQTGQPQEEGGKNRIFPFQSCFSSICPTFMLYLLSFLSRVRAQPSLSLVNNEVVLVFTWYSRDLRESFLLLPVVFDVLSGCFDGTVRGPIFYTAYLPVP